MKFGIITDAHLFHRYAITPEKYKEIIQNLNDNTEIEFIVDCGDLADKSILTAPQVETLTHIFDCVNKPVYIVAGNHDSLEGTTVATALELNPNVKVIKEPTIIKDLLFVPYINTAKELYSKLNNLVSGKNIPKYAFSHINVTSNIYSMIPFRDVDKLFKYAKYWYNGHIHTEEKRLTVFGKFTNIGACSNLTFGDNHIPCYTIVNVNSDKIVNTESYYIDGSIIHRVFNTENLDKIYDEIDYATRFYKMRCRFKLPNSEDSLEMRKRICQKFESNPNILSLNFDYVKTEVKKQKQEVKVNKEKLKLNLYEQLFQHFEEDTQLSISKEIKEELMS